MGGRRRMGKRMRRGYGGKSYTHDGLKQACCCEEPWYTECLRHGALRHEPHQYIGEDPKWHGQNNPEWRKNAFLKSILEKQIRSNGENVFELRSTYHGMSLPIGVRRLRLTRYPISGSVTASQARLTNRIMET